VGLIHVSVVEDSVVDDPTVEDSVIEDVLYIRRSLFLIPILQWQFFYRIFELRLTE